jgi:hypothetical protein
MTAGSDHQDEGPRRGSPGTPCLIDGMNLIGSDRTRWWTGSDRLARRLIGELERYAPLRASTSLSYSLAGPQTFRRARTAPSGGIRLPARTPLKVRVMSSGSFRRRMDEVFMGAHREHVSPSQRQQTGESLALASDFLSDGT